jgi:RNA recognition motif-containing protein
MVNTSSGADVPSSASCSISSRIFVGRVLETMTERDIQTTFDAEASKIDVGAHVKDVYIPKPFKGYAFVTFNSRQVSAQCATTLAVGSHRLYNVYYKSAIFSWEIIQCS